jgi:hypothetical protein
MTVNSLLAAVSLIGLVSSVGVCYAHMNAPTRPSQEAKDALGKGYVCDIDNCNANDAHCEPVSWWGCDPNTPYCRSKKTFSNPGKAYRGGNGGCDRLGVPGCPYPQTKWCSYVVYFYEPNCNRKKDEYVEGVSSFCAGGNTSEPVVP